MDPNEPPPEEAPEERWKTVRPVGDWRQKEARQGLLSRYPVLGIVLVVALALGLLMRFSSGGDS